MAISGDDLRAARERAGWSQEELGAQVGVTGRTIRAYEKRGDASIPAYITREVSKLEIWQPQSAAPVALVDYPDLKLITDIYERLAEIGRRLQERSTTIDGQGRVAEVTDTEVNP